MEITGLKKLQTMSKLGYIAARRPFMKRVKANVQLEYESSWKFYLQFLEQCHSLQEWLFIKGFEDKEILCNVNGKISFTSFNMMEYNRQHLVECLTTKFKHVKSITEFGSGLGRNLLFIKNLFPHIECYGYELCHNGVDVANRARDKFGLDVQYSQLDFINDGEEKYIFPATDVAFTMYALEQIPTRSDIALQHILDHVKQGSIHIEPVVENYPYTLRGMIARVDHWKIDYLRHFEKHVRQLPQVRFSKKALDTAHNPLMYPTLYCIEKI